MLVTTIPVVENSEKFSDATRFPITLLRFEDSKHSQKNVSQNHPLAQTKTYANGY